MLYALLIEQRRSATERGLPPRAIEGGEIEGELTLSCVPGVAANWLVPNLGRFVSMHSNIAVHVAEKLRPTTSKPPMQHQLGSKQ